MALSDSGQAGVSAEPLGIPHYCEAMQIIADWETDGGEFSEIIPRLCNLWVGGQQVCAR